MSVFRIWNRVPPSGEWHLSGKRLAGRVLVTRRFAAGWAAQSDSYLGNRSTVPFRKRFRFVICGQRYGVRVSQHQRPPGLLLQAPVRRMIPATSNNVAGHCMSASHPHRGRRSGWGQLRDRCQPDPRHVPAAAHSRDGQRILWPGEDQRRRDDPAPAREAIRFGAALDKVPRSRSLLCQRRHRPLSGGRGVIPLRREILLAGRLNVLHPVHRLAQAASSQYICRRARLEFPSGWCSGRLCQGL